MRQKITDEVAAAARNDPTPLLGILPEKVALKRIDFVANEANDGHDFPFGFERRYTITDCASCMVRLTPNHERRAQRRSDRRADRRPCARRSSLGAGRRPG